MLGGKISKSHGRVTIAVLQARNIEFYSLYMNKQWPPCNDTCISDHHCYNIYPLAK